MASNRNLALKKSDDKHCLNNAENSVTVPVLKIKSIRAECFVNMNVYSFQEITDMHVLWAYNGNSKEAGRMYKQSLPRRQFPNSRFEHML
jgi:hypothetical protein